MKVVISIKILTGAISLDLILKIICHEVVINIEEILFSNK
jgi:hypothetical protein